ncbi:hypothetical protein EXE58_05250 [Nocardioides seonyuensis]|uniref:Transglycosylase SLT domain-containing protein n=1 Tax=Nocardioides seonyuensis TaxID=2518371 RepID=A0A4P7IGQ9_9ACTN|nr:lytic murein transglycosylase [Nocardioides seonyuensis]QBX54921.1 hypothetical protein EXE58_05250 [Nocardioides seonyuensis]
MAHAHRATAIVPLALISAAWTVSLAGVGTTTASADDDRGGTLPDGTSLPAEAVEAPASVSRPANGRVGLPTGTDASGIPQAALAAYQRAQAVINEADPGCRVPWELIAAIGRVESDHGRFGGNELDTNGVARPGIYGVPLKGQRGTQRITDTDAGQYDDDTRFDRAVGPMQFIPSTWAVVGVDGDNDGRRNPQDIDDSALAAAVYLCSGEDDLSAEQGQRASVYRYNHSNDYVELVLAFMRAYMDGDFSSVPTAAGQLLPEPVRTGGGKGGPAKVKGGGSGSKGGGKEGGKGTKTTKPTPTPTAKPTATPTATPTQTPTSSPTATRTPEPTSSPSVPTTLPSTTLPTLLPSTTLPPLPTATIPQPLTQLEAQARCLAQGVVDNPLTSVNELSVCIDGLMNP